MGHAIVRNEPLHGMRLKGHEVMRKEIFALSVESSLSQHENQNEKFDSALINRTFITVLILLSIPFWRTFKVSISDHGPSDLQGHIPKMPTNFLSRRRWQNWQQILLMTMYKNVRKKFALVQNRREIISRKHKNVRKFSGTEIPSLFP